jgi:SAM-dependent methyltransferase
MNDAHLVALASDEWRDTLRDRVLPFAFGTDGAAVLGDDPLEIGPGPGLTTDLLRADLEPLTCIELDRALADALRTRLAGTEVDVVEGDATAMPFDDDRFSGIVTFAMLHHVPEVELQDRVFAESCRVLRPGGLFIATDSRGSDDLAAFHVDDTYNPIDPSTLAARLTAAGFEDINLRDNAYAWTARARKPA